MFIRQIVTAVSASSVIALLCLAAMVMVPTSVQATDIAWHSTATLKEWDGSKWMREGTAVFKTGEKASLVGNGTTEALDEKGVRPYKGQYLLRFNDGSTITIQVAGKTDITTGRGTGSGEFVNGTGRFEGITGRVTSVSVWSDTHGQVTDSDSVGSYSLPTK